MIDLNRYVYEWKKGHHRNNTKTVADALGTHNKRKRRLFACACCRVLCWDMLKDDGRAIVEASEDFADGKISSNKLKKVQRDAIGIVHGCVQSRLIRTSAAVFAYAAACAVSWRYPHQQLTNINRVYDFMVSDFHRQWETYQSGQGAVLYYFIPNRFTWDDSWNTETVNDLATAMYNDRNWDTRLILADALEDAACNPEITDEFRGRTDWFRGDWLLDQARGFRS